MAIVLTVVILAVLITVIALYLRPVKNISITNSDVQYNDVTGKYKIVHLGDDGVAYYQIEYEASPAFSKSGDVRFEYKARDGVTVSDDGLVKFTKEGYVKVKLVSKDGRGNAEDNIMIIAKE